MTVSYNSDFTPRYNTLYLIINHLSNWTDFQMLGDVI